MENTGVRSLATDDDTLPNAPVKAAPDMGTQGAIVATTINLVAGLNK